MTDLTLIVRRHAFGIVLVLLPAAGAILSWRYGLPIWVPALCLVFLIVAIVALLGNLGLFGGTDAD